MRLSSSALTALLASRKTAARAPHHTASVMVGTSCSPSRSCTSTIVAGMVMPAGTE